MNISYFPSKETMSQKAADIILEEVQRNPALLICTATGSSPKILYQILAKESQRQTTLFQKVRVIPLDEWIGLSTPEASCHTAINEEILKPLQITKDRYFGFDPDNGQLEKECERIQELLNREGPIDVCILGLGKNGHLGFNEPSDTLQPHCHIANLEVQSQNHSMIKNASFKSKTGLTLGMQDILSAKKIILLVSGAGKEDATRQLLSGLITNVCPASWLWKHKNVYCLIEK